MKRISLFFLFVVELFICFLQIILFFVLPYNSYDELNPRGKMLALMGFFAFTLFVTTGTNALLFLIAFLSKNYKLKLYTFPILIATYSFITTTIIFYNFGPRLLSFEIIAAAIIFGCNSLCVVGYVKLYKRLVSLI